jgi:hypothetical protein
MAAYISFQPTDFFIPKLYTGTAATNSITGVGFTPNYVWFKGRSGSISHQLYDTVRGNDSALVSSSDAAAIDATGDGFTSLDADGYTFNSSGGGGNVNGSGSTYVAWNWKMGTTSGLSGGTITPSSYSISTTARQSIIAYTGTGAVATIPHGLGVKPDLIITKQYNTGRNWSSYWTPLTAENYLTLNTTAAAAAGSTFWAQTEPTSTVFSVGSADETNGTGTMVAYCFANTTGYSKFGSYTGNGNADGTFIYTGFRPAYILVKRNEAAYNWGLQDTARDTYNPADETLNADDAASVQTGSGQYIDYLSNGFKMRNSSSWWNGNGAEFIYAAFAEFPLVSSNSKAGTAR